MNIPISSESGGTNPNTLPQLCAMLLKEKAERLRLTRIILEIIALLYHMAPDDSAEREVLSGCAAEVRSAVDELVADLEPLEQKRSTGEEGWANE